MRLKPLLLVLLAVALALPSPVLAQNRRKPRVTDPEQAEDTSGETAAKKKKRKHATSVEDDGSTPPAEEAATAPPKKRSQVTSDEETPPPSSKGKAPSDGDDEWAPAPKRAVSDDSGDEQPPPSRRGRSSSSDDEEGSSRASRRSRSDDDSELRGDGEHRRTKTAEEELDPTVEQEEELSGEDEPGNGIAAEFAMGPIFLSGATGSSTTHFFGGFIISYELGRALFSPEWEFLHNNLVLEFSYLGTNEVVGTEEVKVNAWTHYLTLDLLFGFPLPPVLFYAKVGPALMSMPVAYDVQGTVTSFTGVKGGLVYGAGVRTNWYFGRYVGFSTRVELTRYRRGYLDDTLLTLGLGLCF